MRVDASPPPSSVLHLLEELVGGVLVAVLLHLGQVAFLRGDGRVHLDSREGGVSVAQ